MTVYSQDSFDWADTAHTVDRTDSSSSLDTTDGAGTLDPATWNQPIGQTGIISHKAYASSLTSSKAVAYIETSQFNVDAAITMSTRGTNGGLLFRYLDNNNFWYLRSDSADLFQIWRYTSGTATAIGSSFSGNANGDILRIVCVGDSIQAYRNGSLLDTISSSVGNTRTKHGFFTGDINARFDDWSASSPIVAYSSTPANTIDISDAVVSQVALSAAPANTVDISETVAINVSVIVNLANTVDISDAIATGVALQDTETNQAEISETVAVTGTLVQFDTWRPVPRFDNELTLICRTPVGIHDTDLTDLTVWTVDHEGLNEMTAIGPPSENGWDSYAHPEWSPDGEEVVVAAETPTEYQLVTLDATGFGS